MIKDALAEIVERDLLKLREEISLYKNEDNLWITEKQISNSAGNLALHLIGNLNHFIGATLGNTGYVRQRDDEFSLKNVPRHDMIVNLENCILIVKESLSKMTDADMAKEFPLEKHGEVVTNLQMLLHLYGHLSYHLGQINYHRRLIA